MNKVDFNLNSQNNFVLLSLGTNIEDRRDKIEQAFEILISSETLENALISSLYETEPVGILEQEWFLNAAVAGVTKLNEYELLQVCKTIEYALGREKRKRWHEREIDIDIILYGNKIIEDEKLVIPHPRMYKRKFVLIPSAEIAPNVMVPKFNMTIKQLQEDCLDTSEVKIFA